MSDARARARVNLGPPGAKRPTRSLPNFVALMCNKSVAKACRYTHALLGAALAPPGGLDRRRARARLQLEDPEVALGHVHRHVVDRHRPHEASEAAAVCVSMKDEVRPVLLDRPRQPVRAE